MKQCDDLPRCPRHPTVRLVRAGPGRLGCPSCFLVRSAQSDVQRVTGETDDEMTERMRDTSSRAGKKSAKSRAKKSGGVWGTIWCDPARRAQLVAAQRAGWARKRRRKQDE